MGSSKGRRGWLAAVLVVALVVLSGCAGAHEAASGDDLAGFWPGLWHGFITPVSLVISWFSSDVGVYEVDNNGGWYDTGFVLGASVMFGSVLGGGSKAAGSRR